ncbi:MAG TPA: hypothetical protein VFU35_02030 [Jatrophihabitans sp.]|nr:hypothetical protein [Jatrophihabitans sp.]
MAESPMQTIKRAPVTTLTTAEALTGAILTFLVTHNIIGNLDVSTTTQTIAPFVALALPAAFGAAKWALVSPYEKVKHWAEQDGLVADADFARFEALLDAKLTEFNQEADVAAEQLTDRDDEADDTDLPEPTEPPPGMGAGGAGGAGGLAA